MNQLFFSSVLSNNYYDDLEELMFFNPQQGKIKNGVVQSVERYGNPKIIHDRVLLRIGIGSFSTVQALFGFDRQTNGNLIGVIAYVRELDSLAILHVAVREEYSATGIYADRMLTMQLIYKVRAIGSQIKGINFIKIMYKEATISNIPVRRLARQENRSLGGLQCI